MVKEGEKVPLFNHPLFNKSKYWELSTSNISSEHLDGFGNNELVPGGIALTYVIKKNKICFNLTQNICK